MKSDYRFNVNTVNKVYIFYYFISNVILFHIVYFAPYYEEEIYANMMEQKEICINGIWTQ